MAIEELARKLWDARRSGGAIDMTRVALPETNEAAYAVQQRMMAFSGARQVGFKIGSTSIEAQRLLGTTEPGSGPLLAPFVHDSPADVPVSRLHMPQIEGEFAFRLGSALPARAELYSRDDVARAIDAVAGAIEVVGTRFSGGLAGKGRLLTTADGGVNIAFAAGRWERAWTALDLPSHNVRMTINGRVSGEGTGARALGDPMNVMVWLANQQSSLGRGLFAGEIVSTGTCTGLASVEPGGLAVADFGTLGTVSIKFTDMTPKIAA